MSSRFFALLAVVVFGQVRISAEETEMRVVGWDATFSILMQGDSRLIDLREECPTNMELGCLSQASKGEVFFRKRYLVRNDSDVFTKARDMNEVRRYGEAVVFAYLDNDFFSSELVPYILTAARVFPNVVFLRVEGRRAGYLLGGVLPKSFPVVMFMKKNGQPVVYNGSHKNLTSLLEFVTRFSTDAPLTWTPELASREGTVLDSLSFPSENQLVDFLRPPPRRRPTPWADPFFVVSAIFVLFNSSVCLARFCFG